MEKDLIDEELRTFHPWMAARGLFNDRPRYDTVAPNQAGEWECKTRNKGGANGTALKDMFRRGIEKAKQAMTCLSHMPRRYYSQANAQQFGDCFCAFVNAVIFDGKRVIDKMEVHLAQGHGLPETGPTFNPRRVGRPRRGERYVQDTTPVEHESMSITELSNSITEMSMAGSVQDGELDVETVEQPSSMDSWAQRLWFEHDSLLEHNGHSEDRSGRGEAATSTVAGSETGENSGTELVDGYEDRSGRGMANETSTVAGTVMNGRSGRGLANETSTVAVTMVNGRSGRGLTNETSTVADPSSSGFGSGYIGDTGEQTTDDYEPLSEAFSDMEIDDQMEIDE